MSEVTDREQALEVEQVVRWRCREALEAGMSRQDAAEYAESEIPAGQLRRLVKLNCPPDLLAKILGCNTPN